MFSIIIEKNLSNVFPLFGLICHTKLVLKTLWFKRLKYSLADAYVTLHYISDEGLNKGRVLWFLSSFNNTTNMRNISVTETLKNTVIMQVNNRDF